MLSFVRPRFFLHSVSTLTYITRLMSFWSAHTHARVLDLPTCCCSCRPTLLGEQFVTINWVIHMHNYKINVRARIDFANWLYNVFNVSIRNNRYMLDHIQLSALFLVSFFYCSGTSLPNIQNYIQNSLIPCSFSSSDGMKIWAYMSFFFYVYTSLLAPFFFAASWTKTHRSKLTTAMW